MRRIADVPSVARYIVLALVLVLLFLAGRSMFEKRLFVKCRLSGVTTIHVKYKPGRMVMAGEAVPLFPHAYRSTAAYDDPRARWIIIGVPSTQAQATLERLERDPDIESALIPPEVTLPTVAAAPRNTDDHACPINTPSFESYQGYLGPAPHGIDAPAAWRRGIRGQGVWFADIEGGWNSKHEDLPGDRITHVGGRMINDPGWRAHGTAVLGEVVGRDNAKGVVGIAPDVERVFTSSIGGIPTAQAIDNAAEALRPGDVLLIELQGGGPRGRYLPMEYWDDNFDAIQAATQRGVIVIEAAGNGGEDLDHAAYKGKLTRGKRESGAIMVGAGGPPREGFDDRARLDYSNYGTRVDVQGWGYKVATLDYGDLQSCTGTDRDDADRDYTGEFAGTSSASPIVAGAAVLLQSYAKQQGRLLSPQEVRDILSHTGTPQTGNTEQNIGPRPDLSRALLRVQRYAAGMLDMTARD